MLTALGLRGAFTLLLVVGWEAVRLLNGAGWSWEAIAWRWLAVVIALTLNVWASGQRKRWVTLTTLSFLLFSMSCWLGLRETDTRLAWFATTTLFALLLALESAFWCEARAIGRRLARLEHAVSLVCLALVGGTTLTVLAQVEAQFAEEEFFAALQAVFLTAFCLFILLLQIIARRFDSFPVGTCFRWRPLWGILSLIVFGAGLAGWSMRTYQSSFYALAAPRYGGISEEEPYLCAVLPTSVGAPQGKQVFEEILDRIERNPQKGTPEYGMLALATGDPLWADNFRRAILDEANAGAYTLAANSVKYGQRLAALRVYYFTRAIQRFPDLFSDEELSALKDWFGAINRRAMTVEWVDMLYSVAFSVWPEGPYENQETGAGLLALLEFYGLGDGNLAEANRDYLARAVRGWAQRYRNTDDAYTYQAEWIDNAIFQEIFHGVGLDAGRFERYRRLAFEWLLLQMLPGGEALSYNRPGAYPLGNVFYLGALLLDDPRYVWAADRSLSRLDISNHNLYAQPGLDRAVDLTGTTPTEGSCLLFTPSGLPTQLGPLAPDKVVFRDGWNAGATYMLLNLRFTGWHRYKATNGISLLYQDEPLVVEDTAGESFAWLPAGRSHFRDKRIPRENLNGFLIPRSGFGQVVFSLVGLNGPWAQDPPHHAFVEDFSTLGLVDSSRTIVEDWRGWRHQRSVYFVNQGPVIVVDDARHAGGGESAVTWHLTGLGDETEGGIWLRKGDDPIRMALSPASWSATTITAPDMQGTGEVWNLTYAAQDSGRLGLVSAFLMNGWGEAESNIQELTQSGELIGQYVRLNNGRDEIQLLHNSQSQVSASQPLAAVAAEGMRSDGLALLTFGRDQEPPHTVCLIQGTRVSLEVSSEPSELRIVGSHASLPRGEEWEWAAGVLTIQPADATSVCINID